ncbi:RNase H domain-containing protein [Trichonephila clavipes]|nr:RNase H domain-containing protein [Trichonephila clavipes]
MGAHTSKNQDPPEYLRQLALEIINKIPATAMQIYTDGSKDEQNSCGSGIFIKAPNCSHNIKIRNSDFCSVFRSELIAIDEALRIIKTMTSPDEIWILCDSRSAIQHLSDWTNVGDKTSVSILKNLKELSQQHEIYFQWIPSHIGLFGNDTADLLAKEGVTENLMSRRTLTFSEIFSKTKSLIQELWKTPPTHPWYNRQAPGGALSIKADRVVQTTISRLASGHIRGLSFNLGQKIYENCTKCNLVKATPDHLLFCAGLEREYIYSSPLLVQLKREIVSTSTDLANQNTGEVFLQTLALFIENGNSKQLVRVILDTGSQKSYISEYAAKFIGLKRSDVIGKLFTGEVKQLSEGLTAVNTRLGWTVMGKLSCESKFKLDNSLLVHSLFTKREKISDLCELDYLGIKDPSEKKSKLELQDLALKHFENTVLRDDEGRYIVSIPWIEGNEKLEDHYSLAKGRLEKTVKTLKFTGRLFDYEQVFVDWEKEGIIEKNRTK